MKRLVAFTAFAVLMGSAFAQSGFTIRRPVDGAVVRETVEIRIPARSIPDTGFVGIWINGTFYEAVGKLPGRTVFGEDFVYRLNTKDRGIPDGKMKIEAVLYVDTQESTRVLGRTSIEAFLDNKSSIRVPDRGFDLRYNLTPGREWTYSQEMTQTISNTTETQMALNRENKLASEVQRIRYRYTTISCEKNPGGGMQGVVMLQPMPPKGKDYAFLTLSGETTPKRYDQRTMHPLYMKITDKGREIWGSVPFYSPMEGTFGEPAKYDLYGFFPLPVLPSGGVRMREASIPGFIPQGGINLEKILEQEKFTQMIPANGRLEAIEYERGLRCLRIKNTMALGSGAAQQTDTQSVDETYWFAIDLGAVIKFQRAVTMTQRVRPTQQSGGAGGGGGAPSGPTAAGASGGAGGGSTQGANWFSDPSGRDYEWLIDPTGSFLQGRPGGRGGSRPGGGGPSFSGANNGSGSASGGGAGGGRGQTRLMKITVAYTLTLE